MTPGDAPTTDVDVDELEQARRRIDVMERELRVQQKLIGKLRRRVAGGESAPPRPRRNVVAALGAVSLLAVAAGFWLLRRDESPRPSVVDDAVASSAPSVRLRAARPVSSSRERGPREVIMNQRGRFPDDDEVQRLQARCARPIPRETVDEMPAGTHVIDFKACLGCDCCMPGGVFPPLFGEDHRAIPSTGECMACSKQATLKSAGITIDGGRSEDPLDGGDGLKLTLARPARVFALAIQGGGYAMGGNRQPDARVVLLAYDSSGNAVDAARVIYPMWRAKDDPRRDFDDQKQVLLVQACPGETLTRFELKTTDINVRVSAIAL